MSINQLTVTYEEIQNLVPYARNARNPFETPNSSDRQQYPRLRLHHPVLVNRSRMIAAATVALRPPSS